MLTDYFYSIAQVVLIQLLLSWLILTTSKFIGFPLQELDKLRIFLAICFLFDLKGEGIILRITKVTIFKEKHKNLLF